MELCPYKMINHQLVFESSEAYLSPPVSFVKLVISLPFYEEATQ